jgi:positive regulator of sigma E activity
MIVRFTVCMLALFVSLFDTHPLRAHEGHAPEGHAHVRGTVTAVSDGQLVVRNTSGQTVVIQLDLNTRYRATSLTTSSETVQVGDRVVVEVTEEANGLRAAEVRYAAVAPRTP